MSTASGLWKLSACCGVVGTLSVSSSWYAWTGQDTSKVLICDLIDL